MNHYLDDLGRRVRQETAIESPTEHWLRRRRSQRRRRRWLTVGVAGLVLVGGGLVAATRSSPSPDRTEAVAANPEDGSDGSAPPEESTTTVAPGRATANDGPTEEADDPVEPFPGACGPWPSAVELWPGRETEPPIDTFDGDGRMIRGQSIDGFAIEVHWPPSPRVEYDIGALPPDDLGFWSTESDRITRFGIDGGGSPAGPTESAPGESVPGLEFARVSADDPTLSSLEGPCAEFEFRLLEGDQLIGQVGFGFESLGELEEFDGPDGQIVSFPKGFDWLQLGPIVVEQRAVDAIPGSVTCDGVLVDVETTTYRVDEPFKHDLTLAQAVASGHLTEIADPLAASATADPTESWAVVLPGAGSGTTIGELNEQGVLHLIDASYYEDFVDPETGPTSGPGVSGSHERPIDALQAFFDHPAARTFITSDLVELMVDESTVAYGVPQGHGEGGWITVIATERVDDGWLVTGWTSAGC